MTTPSFLNRLASSLHPADASSARVRNRPESLAMSNMRRNLKPHELPSEFVLPPNHAHSAVHRQR